MIALLISLTPASANESGEATLLFQVETGVPLDLGIEDICCSSFFSSDSALQSIAVPAFGEKATWLRIAEPLPAGLIQIKPIVDRATLYLPLPEGGWQTVETGDMIANSLKLFPSPFMALPLPDHIADGPIFVRIEQFVPVSLSVSHWRLPAFSAMQSRDQTLKMFLLGILSAMICYNLLLSGAVRDPVFALNAACIFTLLTVALYLSGYGAAYVWTGTTGLSNAIFLAAVIASIINGGAFLWLFVRSAGGPLWSAWPMLLMPAAVLLLPVTLIALPLWLVTILALGCGATLFAIALVICINRAFRGEAKARLLLFPLLLAMIPGTILVALDKYFGIQFLPVRSNGMEVTLCLEAVLFSLALASRIRITERETRRASERIVALQMEATTKSIAAQDSERKRLAKELHDGVGQDFLVVLGGLKQLAGTLETGKLTGRLNTLIGAAANALGNLRRISRDMHPASLEHLGLARALGELAKQTEAADAIEIRLDVDFDENLLSGEQRLHLYRITQECLSNTLRHAAASICWIELTSNAREAKLVVADNGSGFDGDSERAKNATAGLGFTSIDERVRACEGRWRKGASDHGGARIEIVLPVSKPGHEAEGREP